MPKAEASFEFAGFLDAVRHLEPFLNVAAIPIVEATGELIVAVAKSLAPVDTDALQQDIKVQGTGVDNKGTYVDVGTTEPYALYQEFGTVHNRAHPFMRPAIAQVTGGGLSSSVYAARVALAPRRSKSKK